MNNGKNKKHKTTYKEVLMAFYEYLRRPKTVFDIKDRLKALIFFAIIIWILEEIAQFFCQDVI
jgi:hypothetical protein